MRIQNLPILSDTVDNSVSSWLNKIVSSWNSQDSGGAVWTRSIALGSLTGYNAIPGQVGELIRSASSGNVGTSNQFWNATSIALIPGDWDISGCLEILANSATITSTVPCSIALSVYSGNTTTDHVQGDNVLQFFPPTSGAAASVSGMSIPSWSVSIQSKTTYYLKGLIAYTVGTPEWFGRISARRMS